MKIGDEVSVIDDTLWGTIVCIKGSSILLEDSHGFTYEFPREKLVVRTETLYENQPAVIKKEQNQTRSKAHHKKPFLLDLHFEKLVQNPEEYSAAERLFLQRQKLLETLEYCRKNKLKRLEIIHGIGQGVLQNMVYGVLEAQTGLEFHNREILHHQSGTVLVYFI